MNPSEPARLVMDVRLIGSISVGKSMGQAEASARLYDKDD
jgi:hypothetical protein